MPLKHLKRQADRHVHPMKYSRSGQKHSKNDHVEWWRVAQSYSIPQCSTLSPSSSLPPSPKCMGEKAEEVGPRRWLVRTFLCTWPSLRLKSRGTSMLFHLWHIWEGYSLPSLVFWGMGWALGPLQQSQEFENCNKSFSSALGSDKTILFMPLLPDLGDQRPGT